ncbi:hypothetical protein K470DRAFT_260690 [Piedraia hortae CBS 480.64]|uniref:Uncharacterized protein n=1 Tax=Piedraia hortae CBS 480.64 TaxID=1314780 RepID=A0A6A7BS90_9PEZI|nr:hypothetical protein K470DRAFT_260690 [Piedraia hortae CBS 480.64]
MNRILKKKASPEPSSVPNRPLSPTTPAPPPKKSAARRWKKTKKTPEAAAAEPVNIAAILPSSDDFRTSLLLPNLSARFSMLRQQDDPNSILGKANDDSVLPTSSAPHLGHISEVSSLTSSPRPPFADSDPFAIESGYGSDGDVASHTSVMSRPRPGEANVMFGGRQKVYRIPTSGSSSSTGKGKAMYEADVHLSAFQRHRKEQQQQQQQQQQRDQQRDQQEQREHVQQVPVEDLGFDFGLDDAGTTSDSYSFEQKAPTVSSPSKSDARLSTAATSITSQSVAPSPQQVSTPSFGVSGPKRSDTKTRRLYEQSLNQDLQEHQAQALTRLNSIARSSPPNFVSSPSESVLQSSLLAPSATTSPERDGDVFSAPLHHALEPGDRGKATAMGAFKKPARQFDENQYLERQAQIRRTHSKSALRPESPRSMSCSINPAERDQSAEGNVQRPVPKRADSLQRKKAPSTWAYQKYNAGRQRQLQTPLENAPEAIEEDATSDAEPQSASTFEPPNEEARFQNCPLPPLPEDPVGVAKGFPEGPQPVVSEEEPPKPPAVDSPTLGPTLGSTTAAPLRGLIHHLRQQSAASSIWPGDDDSVAGSRPRSHLSLAPTHPWDAVTGRNPSIESLPVTDPWEAPLPVASVVDQPSVSRPPSASFFSSVHPVNRPSAEQMRPSTSRKQSTSLETPISQSGDSFGRSSVSRPNSGPWAAEGVEVTMPNHPSDDGHNLHARDLSTATQLEREAFANELAARRAAIQENIKSIVESRGASPVPSTSGARKALGILKSKSSRESLDVRRDPSSKTTRKLGFGSNASSTTLNSQYERAGKSFEGSRSRDNSITRIPPLPGMDPFQSRGRGNSDTSRFNVTSRLQTRERSRSNSLAGRSHSRPRQDNAPEMPLDAQRPRSRSTTTKDQSLHLQTSRFAAVPTSNPIGPIRPSPATAPWLQMPTPPMSASNSPSTSFPLEKATVTQPRSTTLPKKAISKSDISEPLLISSTSNIDLVDLPEGASLKNGMEAQTPFSKRKSTRKFFGRTRTTPSEDAQNYGLGTRSQADTFKSPPPVWTNSPPTPEPEFELARHRATMVHPAHAESAPGSPERLQHAFPTTHPGLVEGGMF